MREFKNRRALSPVIATVILVAVAITVAVAVAYWMGGIAGQYTKFEKVEIQSAPCEYDGTNDFWTVTIDVKNTGTAQATLDKIYINNIEVDTYGAATGTPPSGTTETDLPTTGLSLKSGQAGTIVITIDNGWEFVSSGTTVNIKIHSTGGMEYLKLVELV